MLQMKWNERKAASKLLTICLMSFIGRDEGDLLTHTFSKKNICSRYCFGYQNGSNKFKWRKGQ